MHYKQQHIYIGIDLHKHSHTAVVIDCWNEILTEVYIQNRPSAFQVLLDKVLSKANGLTPVFGLEDVGGNGRSLALFLLEKGCIVKDVNSSLSYAQRMSHPTTKKNDSWDAYCVACVLLAKLGNLPDANPQDVYWTFTQLVNRRDAIVKSMTATTNQLHQQLSYHYPSYGKFFSDVTGITALSFWEEYPAPHCLANLEEEALAVKLRQYSKNSCSLNKAKKILALVREDGDTKRAYQETRDFIVQSTVRDIRFKIQEIRYVEEKIKIMLSHLGYKLETMPGINIVTAAALISQIGDINRFSNAEKLARFAGIAPVRFSSAGKGENKKSMQGNRELHGIFYFLAVQQVQVAKKSKLPRNPIMYEYYQRKVTEKKTKKQALVCVMRRLVNIIYGMMKRKTAYIMPVIQEKVAV